MADVKTRVVIAGDSSQGVNAAKELGRSVDGMTGSITAAKGAMAEMSTQTRETNRTIKESGEAQKKTRAELALLNDTIRVYGKDSKEAAAQTGVLNSRMKAAEREFKKAQGELEGLRRKFEETKRSTGESSTAMLRLEKRLKQAEAAVERKAMAQKRLALQVKATTKDIRLQETRIQRWGARLKSARSTLSSGIGKLGGYARAAAVAAAAVAGTAAAVGAMTTAVAESGDEIAKTAKKYGTGVEEIQRLRFAADRSGAASEKLTLGIANLSKRFEDAAVGRGNKRFLESLEDLGLTLDDLNNKSAEEKLGAVGDALRKIQDPAQRTAIAMELMGRKAGPELVPLLLEGSEGITELGNRAEELGLVMSDQATRGAEAFVDAQTDLKAALTGTRNAIVNDHIPAMTASINKTTEWLTENRALISSGVDTFLEGLGDVWEGIQNRIEVVMPLLRRLQERWEGIRNAAAPFVDLLKDGAEAIGNLAAEATDSASPFEAMGKAITFALTPLDLLVRGATAAAEEIGALSGAMERFARKHGEALSEELDERDFAEIDSASFGGSRVIPLAAPPKQRPRELENDDKKKRRRRKRPEIKVGSRAIEDAASIDVTAELAEESERRHTEIMAAEAERRAQLLEEETALRKKHAEEQARVLESLAEREKVAAKIRQDQIVMTTQVATGALAQLTIAAFESAEGEKFAAEKRLKAFATGIRDQMIATAAKETALAAVAAATYNYPGAAAHGAAAALAASAAVVAGGIAGAIQVPEESSPTGETSTGTASGGGGASSGGRSTTGSSQAPVSRQAPAAIPTTPTSNSITINIGTFVGGDEQAVDELARQLEERLRRFS